MAILGKNPLPVGGARIGYGSILTGVTGAGADAPNTLDYNTSSIYSFTFPTITYSCTPPEDCNFLAIAAHNLGSLGDVTITATTAESGTPTDNLSLGIVEANEKNPPLFFSFDTRVVGNITVVFNTSTGLNFNIGHIMLGEYLEMPNPIMGGHSPANLSVKTEYQGRHPKSGQFLGKRKTRESEKTVFTFNNLDAEWYRENFAPFVEHAKSKPFFIQWRPDKYTEEVSFGYVEGDVKVRNQTHNLMSVTFNFIGHISQ